MLPPVNCVCQPGGIALQNRPAHIPGPPPCSSCRQDPAVESRANSCHSTGTQQASPNYNCSSPEQEEEEQTGMQEMA